MKPTSGRQAYLRQAGLPPAGGRKGEKTNEEKRLNLNLSLNLNHSFVSQRDEATGPTSGRQAYLRQAGLPPAGRRKGEKTN
ncbi:MAG: hypothetical protein R6U66_06305 [Bacteroidales bacterium]